MSAYRDSGMNAAAAYKRWPAWEVVALGGSLVVVAPGATVRLGELAVYSIALDGFVQGPEIDLAGHRFSFDHHGGCLRLVTSATCRQAADALLLGLDPGHYTLYVNDVDADTVLATALLAYPDLLTPGAPTAAVTRALVDVVATRDAHGPAYPVGDPALLATFTRRVALPRQSGRPGDGPSPAEAARQLATDLAVSVQAVLGLVAELAGGGSVTGPEGRLTKAAETGPVQVTHEGTGWVMVRDPEMGGFEAAYALGHTRVVLWNELPDGSTAYTVARRSDLVDDFPVGPSEESGTILAALASREPGWGGGSTVGGAPRHPDRARSRLDPDEVFTIVEDAVAAARQAG